MIKCNISEFRCGLKIIINNEPNIIIKNEFVKLGKGQPFNRVKLKNLISGKIVEKIFKSSELVKIANVENIKYIYLYNDGKLWFFFNKKTLEKITVDKKVIGNKVKWLIKQTECILTIWNEKVIAVDLPRFINIKIIKTSSESKFDTISSVKKIATLETGINIKVPFFIKEGEIIKLDTRSGEYISKIKKN